MKLLRNRGNEQVVDRLRAAAICDSALIATADISLFGLLAFIDAVGNASAERRLIVPETDEAALCNTGQDRSFRNRLGLRRYGSEASQWLSKAGVRAAGARPPMQSAIILEGDRESEALIGACALTSDGLGLAPQPALSLVQVADARAEKEELAVWFRTHWETLGATADASAYVHDLLASIGRRRSAREIHLRILDALFSEVGAVVDQEQVVRSATGIRDTVVWAKLYRFQRDGVVGAIDKLQRYGGCILADSVGLGKTFESRLTAPI